MASAKGFEICQFSPQNKSPRSIVRDGTPRDQTALPHWYGCKRHRERSYRARRTGIQSGSTSPTRIQAELGYCASSLATCNRFALQMRPRANIVFNVFSMTGKSGNIPRFRAQRTRVAWHANPSGDFSYACRRRRDSRKRNKYRRD